MMKIVAGVYRIKNILNDKVYIGSSYNINCRLNGHKKLLINNKHYASHLQYSYNKYGLDSFVFETIFEVMTIWDWKRWTNEQKLLLKETLFQWEQKYLDENECWKLEKGYNTCLIAGGNLGVPRKGKHLRSEEHKQKIRKSTKEWWTAERRQERSKLHAGRKHTDLAKANMKTAQNRPEVKEKIKNSNKKSWTSERFMKASQKLKEAWKRNPERHNQQSKRMKGNRINAKLTNQQTKDIKTKWLSGDYTRKQLQEEYNIVAIAQIRDIVRSTK